MSYPKTGEEVYVSLNLSNTMLTGLGKGTITREDVSVDYLKKLFMQHGVIVSAIFVTFVKSNAKALSTAVPSIKSPLAPCRGLFLPLFGFLLHHYSY